MKTATTTEKRTLLVRGTDTVGTGTRRGRGVVVTGYHGWTDDNSEWLEFLNENLQGYLLVVPQTATDPYYHVITRELSGNSNPLTAGQFNNAAAVMEMQWQSDSGSTIPIDHTRDGYGGECFKRLGADPDILFVGAPFERDSEDNPLNRLRNCGNYDGCIRVYDIEWEAAIDPETKTGEIYLLGEVNTPEFTAQETRQWGMDIRDWANAASKDPSFSDYVESLYEVSNCLPDGDDSILNFNPYEIEKLGLDDSANGDPTSLIPHLKKVIEFGRLGEVYFPERMESYLEKLLEYLKAQQCAEPKFSGLPEWLRVEIDKANAEQHGGQWNWGGHAVLLKGGEVWLNGQKVRMDK